MENKKENRKNNRLLIVLLLILLVGVSGYLLQDTFSRYVSSSEGTARAQVAPWRIKLNDADVVNTQTFKAGDLVTVPNEYVADGYIAPTSKGYINLVLDPTGTKVATKVTIKVDPSKVSTANSKIKITGVEATDAKFTTDGYTYTAILSLADINKGIKPVIKINLEWENDEANNAKDTETGSKIENLPIPVTATAEQYIG